MPEKTNIEMVMEIIEKMTVLELAELVKALEEKFGVTAAAPVAVAAPGAVAVAEEEEEQTEFNVFMVSFGDKKIQVIKVIRTITGLGLKEAKALVESVPCNVKEGLSKEEAEEIKGKLEEVGAIIDLK